MTIEALFEESFRYSIEADKAFSLITDIDEFSLMFEAENEEVSNQVNANNEATGNTVGFLQKSINALKEIISKIASAIKNFFSYTFASKENKAAFKKFKEECLADPALRDKKITYLDYTEIHKKYDAAIAEAERLEKELAAGRKAEVDAFLSRSEELLKGVSGAAATSVGLQALEKIMYNEESIAKGISFALRTDSRILEEIERSLGASRAKDFQNKADIAAGKKRLSLLRFKIMLERRKQQDIETVMKKFTSDLKSQFSSKASLLFSQTGRDVLKNKEMRDIIKGSDDVSRGIRDAGATAVRIGMDAATHGAASGAASRVTNPITKLKMKRDAKRQLQEAQKARENAAHLKRFLKLDKKKDQQ